MTAAPKRQPALPSADPADAGSIALVHFACFSAGMLELYRRAGVAA